MRQRLMAVALLASVFALTSVSQQQQQSAKPGRWRLQYFYDENDSQLILSDLEFKSPSMGVACGVIAPLKRGRTQGVVLLTRDGGKQWQRVPVSGIPLDVHFLDDSVGFLLTDNAIYKTEERGLTWKKLKGVDDLLAIHFLDALHGFAVGTKKRMMETVDGGKSWKPVEAAAKPEAKADFTVYEWIAFKDGKRGIVLGGATPPRRRQLQVPEWADPEAAMKQREWPTLSITIETADGGKAWNAQTAPLFGHMSRFRFGPDASPFALTTIRFDHAFKIPSEVHLVGWKSGKSKSVFGRPDRFVTDVGFTSASTAVLAAIERPGTMVQSPLPGKLKMLESSGFESWSEMPVDYRATGKFAILSVIDANNAWVALDSGMILHLEP